MRKWLQYFLSYIDFWDQCVKNYKQTKSYSHKNILRVVSNLFLNYEIYHLYDVF